MFGYFPLLSKRAEELVVGEDDRHLDFRVATLLHTGAVGGRELVAVTAAHCPSRLGRTCLAVIAPFHRTILRANLKRVVRVMGGYIGLRGCPGLARIPPPSKSSLIRQCCIEAATARCRASPERTNPRGSKAPRDSPHPF